VAPAGDVNGDGYDDILIGAPGHSIAHPAAKEGEAFLFYGRSYGVASSPAWTLEGDLDGEQLGDAVGTAGDVNGDGYADVIIGSPGYSGSATDAGRARVYLGSATGLATTAVWTGTTAHIGDQFGASAATAGDVDGDGYSDIIVGAPLADPTGGPTDAGQVYVYRGSATGPSATPVWIVAGPASNSWFGGRVATAGDTNGDGFADVIIGAYNYTGGPGQNSEGKAFLFEGSSQGLGTAAVWTKEGDAPSAMLGYSVSAAGDVNGDGMGDITVGAEGMNDFEEMAWVYAGSAEGLANTVGWSVAREEPGGYMGLGVGAAGDLNGDGYGDILVGEVKYDGGEPDCGRALAFLGTASGPDAAPIWSAEGEATDDYFGVRVAAAGDVNGDGYGDILVSAPFFSIGSLTTAGRVYLYLGSATGISPTPDWVQTGNQQSMRLGNGAAGAGDVNGDGYADVIIGASHYSNGETFEGEALVYLGSASGLGATPAWTAEGNLSGLWFGYCVASAGDVNRDGYSDVIIGGPGHLLGGGGYGRAYLYLGSASGPAASPAWTGSVQGESDKFGFSVSSAGDVNGDGHDDVIVGAPGYSLFAANAGLVAVYLGTATGLSANAHWMSIGDQGDGYLGSVVAGAGDVNGDGYGDVAFSAPPYDGAMQDIGKVFVKPGSIAGLSGSANWTMLGTMPGMRLGESLAGAGDTNGDGYDDLIIGVPYATEGGMEWAGAAWVVLGNDRSLDAPGLPMVVRQNQAGSYEPLEWLGASQSADGFGLAALGRSAAGRTRVRMEWQAAPVGTSLGTIPLSRGAWVLTEAPAAGLGSQAGLQETATGLPPVTACHWRLRIASESPYFPWTPWMSLPRTVPSEVQVRTGAVVDGVEASADLAPRPRLDIHPNPFMHHTDITYTLPAGGPTHVAIHDASGRLVRTLVNETRATGSHVVDWDGRDGNGRALPAGIYWIRLSSGGETGTGTIVRIP